MRAPVRLLLPVPGNVDLLSPKSRTVCISYGAPGVQSGNIANGPISRIRSTERTVSSAWISDQMLSPQLNPKQFFLLFQILARGLLQNLSFSFRYGLYGYWILHSHIEVNISSSYFDKSKKDIVLAVSESIHACVVDNDTQIRKPFTSAPLATMLDINLFRTGEIILEKCISCGFSTLDRVVLAEKGGDPELVRESQRRRFADVSVIDQIIEFDTEWRQGKFFIKEGGHTGGKYVLIF